MDTEKSFCQTQPNAITQILTTYKPLLLIVGYIILGTLISQRNSFMLMDAMRVFMGLFFVAFSFFKLLDLPAFANAYRGYDIPTKLVPVWGYLYPFVELGLGVAYLTNFAPTATNWVALIVMSVSLVGVVQAVRNKTKIKCACLGTGFNLPMSTVTIIEDGTMIAMAAANLFL